MSFTAVVSGETAITARGPVRAAAERLPGRPAGGNDRPDAGVYQQVTGNADRDVAVPGRHHRLGVRRLARALGDARAARSDGRPVVRPHLRSRWAGLARGLDSARGG
ncbi:hypothetical protein F8568_008225 [Actinomadura sp. LD22]|uniref:Uncharacterized protein n=1 Tax=Actinomadura physcomitrii TaxID=2650748 RepID=A0A6I4M5L9_9ACTN|nr:hypothetical protein [Actinomadura physcomitrii]MWA00360.1 hypothetical protein [Actinomadura physcomitrii]